MANWVYDNMFKFKKPCTQATKKVNSCHLERYFQTDKTDIFEQLRQSIVGISKAAPTKTHSLCVYVIFLT